MCAVTIYFYWTITNQRIISLFRYVNSKNFTVKSILDLPLSNHQLSKEDVPLRTAHLQMEFLGRLVVLKVITNAIARILVHDPLLI